MLSNPICHNFLPTLISFTGLGEVLMSRSSLSKSFARSSKNSWKTTYCTFFAMILRSLLSPISVARTQPNWVRYARAGAQWPSIYRSYGPISLYSKPSQVHLTDVWLERCGNNPLNLEIYYNTGKGDYGVRSAAQILISFIARFGRWKKFHLDMTIELLRPLYAMVLSSQTSGFRIC
jgi:hypothetical protein